jgi:hypothetical protein
MTTIEVMRDVALIVIVLLHVVLLTALAVVILVLLRLLRVVSGMVPVNIHVI